MTKAEHDKKYRNTPGGREVIRKAVRKYRAKNPMRFIAYQEARRAKAINVLGGRCWECEESDIELLDIDHRNDDGHVDRKNGRSSGTQLAFDVLKTDRPRERFQVLCVVCHWRKTNRVKREKMVERHERLRLREMGREIRKRGFRMATPEMLGFVSDGVETMQ